MNKTDSYLVSNLEDKLIAYRHHNNALSSSKQAKVLLLHALNQKC